MDGCNVVQAEFFHLAESVSLAALFKESNERASEGSPIKTVLRFQDKSGGITETVQYIAETNRQRAELERQYFAQWERKTFAGWLMLRTLDFRLKKLHGRKVRGTNRLMCMVTHELELLLPLPNVVALEGSRHSFHFVRPDEVQDLRTIVKNMAPRWVFVFESNNLLSDNNKSIDCSM